MPILPQNQPFIPDKEKQPSASKGSGFVNLQRVLQANKGNKLGTSVVGGVQRAGQEASGALQAGQQQFEQGLVGAKGTREQEQQKSQDILNKFNQSGYGGQDIGQQEVSGFNELRNARYQGPQGVANSQDIMNKAQQAQQLGQYAGNREGRQELLRRFVGGVPQYTSKKQGIDELLLSLGGGEGALKQASQANRGLTNQTQEALQKSQFASQDEQRQLDLAKQAQMGAVQNILNPIQEDISGKQKQIQANSQDRQNKVNTFQSMMGKEGVDAALDYAAKNGLMKQEDLNAVKELQGLSTSNQQFNIKTPIQELLAGMDFGNIDTSRGGAASTEQRGKLDALSRLLGQGEEFKNFQGSGRESGLNKDIVKGLANRITNEIKPKLTEVKAAQEGARSQEQAVKSSLQGKLDVLLDKTNLPPAEKARLKEINKTSPEGIYRHLETALPFALSNNPTITEDIQKLNNIQKIMADQSQSNQTMMNKQEALTRILSRYA